MARQRLGVVLTVPEPVATQIDGLRRALGDGALGRIPPHITLVPPVNVAERDLSSAFAVVRRAAEATPPLRLQLGPVATFQPVNPVAYLAVGGEAAATAHLRDLRDRCLAPPLERTQDHDFVPHVTVADDLAAPRLEAAAAVLADFVAEVTFDRVQVLAQQPGRVWVPVADALLGVPPGVVGRGSLPLEISVSGRPDLDAAALLAIDAELPGLPFAITARRDGEVVAAGWGWTAGSRLELADLVVGAAHRGQGIGRHLVMAVEDLGRRRSCTRAGAAVPVEGPAASLMRSCGWVVTVLPDSPARDHRRWERALEPDPAT